MQSFLIYFYKLSRLFVYYNTFVIALQGSLLASIDPEDGGLPGRLGFHGIHNFLRLEQHSGWQEWLSRQHKDRQTERGKRGEENEELKGMGGREKKGGGSREKEGWVWKKR